MLIHPTPSIALKLFVFLLAIASPLQALAQGRTVSADEVKARSNWVIACQATKSWEEADKHAAGWRAKGLPAGVLWIPDFASLSGAKYWLTFVGPWAYPDGAAAARATLDKQVKPHYRDAYGIRVDQNPQRETLANARKQGGGAAPAPAPPAMPKQGGSVWVIACQATQSKAAADKAAAAWRGRGLPAGVLWIPDYASLSGAKYYLTYVGPYAYPGGKDDMLFVLRKDVRPHYADAYGIRVDQNPKRETAK